MDDDDIQKKLSEFIGITAAEFPKVYILTGTSQKPTKYRMEEEFTIENLKSFI